jgi:hypothetical protein
LRVIPAPTRCGVLSDAGIHALVGRERSHECIVDRGGIVVMRPLLVHASSKATSLLPGGCSISNTPPTMSIGPALTLRVA